MAYTFKHGDRPLDDYTIQRAVGGGGFGEVYYAVSDGGREVALKYLRNNPHVELRGVGHCINLKSPYLVSIFDVKKNADEEYFVIMEYCSGPSLRDLLIAEPNGFAPEKAAFFVRELAKGLAYLHDRGIVHRDLKPGNVFFDDGYVKIGDYGLSKFISISRHSAQTASVGTVHYMAPEIGSGNYSRGVDIYALGVMLYEMLLGKVPFEGSSMAEILMKHLTSQPEVDDLPEPFAHVIRKALEKDPKNRYQSIDEMVDDLLAVEEVKKSLAGFATQSLEGAVRRGAVDHADSPVPSPNPAPGYARDFERAPGALPPQAFPVDQVGAGAPLSPRLADKMDRVSRKMEKKMAKLGGYKLPKRPAPTGDPPPPLSVKPQAVSGRGKMALPALVLTAGLVITLSVLFANSKVPNAGGAFALWTLGLSAGIGLSFKASRWFGAELGPQWARGVVRLGLCVPFLFLGAAPLFDVEMIRDPLAVVLGLAILSLLADWDKDRDAGARGELRILGAIWRGFGGGLLCATLAALFAVRPALQCESHGEPGYILLLSGAVVAAATLIIQANAWWLTQGGRCPRAHRSGGSGPDVPEDADVADAPDSPVDLSPAPLPPQAQPAGQPEQAEDHAGPSVTATDPTHSERCRWGITRAFWSVVAFVLMGGMIVTFVTALMMPKSLSHGDMTAIIIGCVGCASFMILALAKTTLVKRSGFWRDSLRPFLISLMFFGVGATITGIAREWDGEPTPQRTTTVIRDDGLVRTTMTYDYEPISRDEARVAMVSGLVLCSLMLVGVTITFFTRRKVRPPHPFLRDRDLVVPGSYGRDPTPSRVNYGGPSGDSPLEAQVATVPRRETVKPHRGVAVLVLGILGITVCPVFGIIAWVMANHDLADMNAGRMDSTGRGMTSAGSICGIISLVLLCCVVAGLFAWAVVAMAGIR